MAASQGELADFLYRNEFAFAEYYTIDCARRAYGFFKDNGIKVEYSKNK